MTTTYPLTIDGFDTHVDNVDDVMAADVNNLNDAVVALETQHRDLALMRVKNTSGSTVAANDVGYIDEAGEFKLTTTANLDVAWAVVVEGAANNADIIIARRGLITVILNGNCSIGDYLYTSTTTKQAQPQSYMRPEVFAVAKTANSSGAGGTCVALLLCNTRYVNKQSSIDIIAVASATTMDWRTTINGAPAGAVVTYTVALTSGTEDTIVPTAANLYGKIRLYNEARTDYALIDSVNVGANTITLTANAPAGWVNTDVITARSQTCVDPGPPPYFYDIDLSSADNTVIPVLARTLELDVTIVDTGAAGWVFHHPWEAYGTSKIQSVPYPVTLRSVSLPLIQRRFCFQSTWSGASTGTWNVRLKGWWEAVP